MNALLIYLHRLRKGIFYTTSIALWAIMLNSCATTSTVKLVDTSLFHDEYFVASETHFNPKSVFELSPEMLNYIRNDILTKSHENTNAKALLYALFDKDKLKLEYDSSYTRTAIEAFNAKSGNCISLVIMTAAFAKKMNLEVTYQSVYTPDNISRVNASMYYSDHVNLLLGAVNSTISTSNPHSSRLVVDFLTPGNTINQRTWVISEHTVLAMYMNNRAAEQLHSNKINDSYWWAKRSIETDPTFLAAYNTLGIVYERHGNLQESKQALEFVINVEPLNIAALSNLARVELKLGNTEASKLLNQRLKQIKPIPPFYFFDLGMAAMKIKNYALARDYFSQEISTAAFNPEFNFWLAGAYIGLKDRAKAKKYLIVARDNASTPADRLRYEEQLKNLQRLIL